MKTTVSALLLSLAALAFATPAGALTKPVKQACQDDYRKYCKDYGIDTPALRSCMDRAGKNLSKICVNALIDAGEVSRAEVNRRK